MNEFERINYQQEYFGIIYIDIILNNNFINREDVNLQQNKNCISFLTNYNIDVILLHI